jgi:DNA-binding NtrC family response regulator
VNLLILVVDDEPDVEVLFRQYFRRDLRDGRFTMEFSQSAPAALQRVTDATGVPLILILSDINMLGMSGLEQRNAVSALNDILAGVGWQRLVADDAVNQRADVAFRQAIYRQCGDARFSPRPCGRI